MLLQAIKYMKVKQNQFLSMINYHSMKNVMYMDLLINDSFSSDLKLQLKKIKIFKKTVVLLLSIIIKSSILNWNGTRFI